MFSFECLLTHPIANGSSDLGVNNDNFFIGFKFSCDGHIIFIIFKSVNLNFPFQIGLWKLIKETNSHSSYYCHNKN